MVAVLCLLVPGSLGSLKWEEGLLSAPGPSFVGL